MAGGSYGLQLKGAYCIRNQIAFCQVNAPSVTPIDNVLQAEVINRTSSLINSASAMFSHQLPLIRVRFDLRGRSAGMFRVRDKVPEIRYNPYIFARYYRSNLSQTVPHEVAHYVVHELFGTRGIKPHGHEWRQVMIAFGCEPKVTCEYDLTGIPFRRTRRYLYRCQCGDHEISGIRHNRMIRHGVKYLCRACKHPLTRPNQEES